MNWKEQRRSLIIPIIGGSIVSLFIGLVGTGNTSALFLNLATDGFTVLITIFVVEKILDHYRKEASAGTRFVAYREVCWINNRFLAFWEELLVYSTSRDGRVDLPFSNSSIANVRRFLDLRSEAPTYPPMKWIDYIERVGAKQKNDIENVLARYSTFLPDEVVESLGNLEHALFFKIVNRNFIGDSASIDRGIVQTSMFDELAENVPQLNKALLEMDLEFVNRKRRIPPRKLDDAYCEFINAKIQARNHKKADALHLNDQSYQQP